MSGLAAEFRERGYVMDDVFSEAEADRHRDAVLEIAGEAHVSGRWNVRHGMSLTPKLWPVITNERLLALVKDVLCTGSILYAEHSDVKVWRRSSASGWHRDSISERYGDGTEWADGYRVVRVACYFQDSAEGFLWGAVPGSHRAEHQLSTWQRSIWRRLQPRPAVEIGSRLSHLTAQPLGRPWIRTGARLRPWHPPATPQWIATRPTACVLFDPRLIHAGGPVDHTKVATFFAFGADDEHTRRHVSHFGSGIRRARTDMGQYLASHGLVPA